MIEFVFEPPLRLAREVTVRTLERVLGNTPIFLDE
jgi:hypothetical protein